MHPDISHASIKHVYTTGDQVLLYDGPDLDRRPYHQIAVKWAASFLGKKVEESRVSVIASVTDGECLAIRRGTSLVNFHNIVAVCKIVGSMIDAGVEAEDILIVFFYKEAYACMEQLLTSQERLTKARIRCASVDSSQGTKAKVVIVEPSMDAKDTQGLGFIENYRRMNVAFTRAQFLRVIVGHHAMGQRCEKQTFRVMFWRDVFDEHAKDGQIKKLQMGGEMDKYRRWLQGSKI
jgi:superfamily I DNA and/or RNA helicase